MPLLLKNKNRFRNFLLILLVPFNTFANNLHIPECQKSITVKNGKVINAENWRYDFDGNFIDEKSKAVTMKDGALMSHFRFPEISATNTFTNSVTGGLSYDAIEERDDFLSMTWDIQKIHETSEAVFVCNFYGDQKTERPVRLIYVYQRVPHDIKECTVSYTLINYERIPESQKLICTK